MTYVPLKNSVAVRLVLLLLDGVQRPARHEIQQVVDRLALAWTFDVELVVADVCKRRTATLATAQGPSAMEATEAFAAALERGDIQWCRARLLRGLALAAKQGVLDEVIDELLDDVDGEVLERILRALVATGWLRSPEDRLVP